MATKYLNLSGSIKYANSRYGGLFIKDDEYGNYKVNFFPDPDSWEKIKKSGLGLKPKTDEDGDYIVFRRPDEKEIKGKKEKFGRPKVFFADEIKDQMTRDIGNGSEANVSVSVYGEGRYIGHRLESVTITRLVEYKGAAANLGVEFKDGDNDPVERAKKEEVQEDEPKVEAKKPSPFRKSR